MEKVACMSGRNLENALISLSRQLQQERGRIREKKGSTHSAVLWALGIVPPHSSPPGSSISMST